MKLDDLEKQKRKSERITVLGICLSAFGFIFFLPAGMMEFPLPFLMMAMFMGGAILAGRAATQFKQKARGFKAEILRNELISTCPDAEYDSEQGFVPDEVYGSRILRRADRFSSGDTIKGTLDGIGFRSADVHLQDVRSTGKSTTVVTTFLGRMYRLDFPHDFGTDMVILQPGFGKKWGFGSEGFQVIETEGIEFNEELLVLAKDPLKALELLTPPFMEKLRRLDDKYRDKIAFSWMGNHLYIAIDTRTDPFEIKLFRSIPDSFLPELRKEMETIRDVAETMDLI
jgi:hypothetical protein